ncbi:hypothetical protein [Nocardioides sp.]|uniref:hypothetical protein n=1 Tax=Nocardioides sp. TaxID=35761 RepID=UPI003219D560
MLRSLGLLGVLGTLGALGVAGLVAVDATGSPEPSVVFAFADPAIEESSGLVVDAGSGLFVTVNDSGDGGRVFTVDPATGRTVGTTRWDERPRDVEALAPAGPGEVWVADIGDNDAERDLVSVRRVPVAAGEVDASGSTTYDLVYPDGARDAETLMVDPDGRLVIVTKGLLGGEVLRTEQPLDADRPNRMTRIGVAVPIATDGAFFPDGRHVIVRSYGTAVVYAYPSLDEVGSFSLPDQEQGEGIAVDASGAVFVSSEGAGSEVLRVPLPRDVRRVVAPSEPDPSVTASPGGDRGTGPDSEAAGDDDLRPPPEPGAQWPWIVAGLVLLLLVALLTTLAVLLVVGARRVLRRRGPPDG